jgi:hypothetical protein
MPEFFSPETLLSWDQNVKPEISPSPPSLAEKKRVPGSYSPLIREDAGGIAFTLP